MYLINKISSHTAIDYAAEELRKYLRMMMPECGNIEIKYAPEAIGAYIYLDRVPEEPWAEVRNTVQEAVIKAIAKKKKGKMVV